MLRDLEHINYILDSIEALYTLSSQGRASFEQLNYWSCQGVLRKLHTLAESAHKLSVDIKEQHPNIRWREIADFRNFLVHDYFGDIDRTVIWSVLVDEVPGLYKALGTHTV